MSDWYVHICGIFATVIEIIGCPDVSETQNSH